MHKFLVSSAINSRFGKFDLDERMDQTKETIRSIQKYAPGHSITLIDMCGNPLQKEQVDDIKTLGVEVLICYDEQVAGLYQINNHDVVKNLTEMLCFYSVFHSRLMTDYERVFKVSGRYLLNENFDLKKYEGLDKIVFSGLYNSQFNPLTTKNDPNDNFQYMSRLWSFPSKLQPLITETYAKMVQRFQEVLQNKDGGIQGYIDIEHLLYKFMPKDQIHLMIPSGLTGQIAPNGTQVND